MAGTIDSLIAALDAASDHSIETLERLLAEHLPSDEEIVSLAERIFPYGRTMLKLNDKYEVIIGCWLRGGWCDAHDHGEAVGVVHSYSGQIEHFEYRFDGGHLELYEQTTLRSGDARRLASGMIHSLQNISSDEPYIGLHVYSPPTKDVRVFDTRTGDIYYITDDSAAVIPKDEQCIKSVEANCFTFNNLVHETHSA